MTANFAYLKAATLDEALTHLAADTARLHAGGTDLLGCLRDGVFACDTVVSISGLDDLRGIRERADGLGIGALVTVAETAADPLIRERYRALAQAAAVVASPQLRNQGTLGGNLCQKPRCWYYRGDFPCLRKGGVDCFAREGQNQYHCLFGGGACVYVHPSDCAPALIALGAKITIRSRRGERSLPLEDFYVLPADDSTRETVLAKDEIVTEILLPRTDGPVGSSYRKVRARGSWDFALAGAALRLTFATSGAVAEARIVLSGVAPVPWRARAAEETLTGERLNATTARAAGRAAVAGAENLERNGYKVPLLQGLIGEELLKLAS